ncbi:MAG: hypothetical protein ACKOFI_03510 [Phycisphaerales bacterium]
MRRAATTLAFLAAVALASCASEPETVLRTDLPQVPGLVPRDSSGSGQRGDQVTAGQFAYKGDVPNLAARVQETRGRFDAAGWKLYAETLSPSMAVLEFRKGDRSARVEIIRNEIQPKMSTAVMTVRTREVSG